MCEGFNSFRLMGRRILGLIQKIPQFFSKPPECEKLTGNFIRIKLRFSPSVAHGTWGQEMWGRMERPQQRRNLKWRSFPGTSSHQKFNGWQEAPAV